MLYEQVIIIRTVCRHLRRIFTEDILRELLGSGEVISELEKEWEQLSRDREALRQIFPSGESKVVLPCNLKRMIWNVQKIFHINKRAPTDLSPLRVIQGVYNLYLKLNSEKYFCPFYCPIRNLDKSGSNGSTKNSTDLYLI